MLEKLWDSSCGVTSPPLCSSWHIILQPASGRLGMVRGGLRDRSEERISIHHRRCRLMESLLKVIALSWSCSLFSSSGRPLHGSPQCWISHPTAAGRPHSIKGHKNARTTGHDLFGAACWSGGYHTFIDHPAVPSGERVEPVVGHDFRQNGRDLFEAPVPIDFFEFVRR